MRVENIQKYFDQLLLYFKKEVKMYYLETDSEQGRLDPGTLSRSPPAREKIHRPDQFGTGRAERTGPGGRARSVRTRRRPVIAGGLDATPSESPH
jgi:hypothetical protein